MNGAESLVRTLIDGGVETAEALCRAFARGLDSDGPYLVEMMI